MRTAALHAAGEVGHPRLWPLVVQALALPELRPAAEEALVRGDAASAAV